MGCKVKKLKENKKGFSLVELIVVIAILAVLAGVVGGAIFSEKDRQTNNVAKVEAYQVLQSARNLYILTLNIETNITFNRDYLISELENIFPEVETFNEAGLANTHRYFVDIIETDGELKYISISFLSAKRSRDEIVQYYSVEKGLFLDNIK